MLKTAVQPKPDFAKTSHADAATYDQMYARSVADPDAFWAEQGKRLDWMTPYTAVKDVSFAHPDVSIKWYADGTLNVSANCIDRHLVTRGDQTAIIWEPDSLQHQKTRLQHSDEILVGLKLN